MPTHADLDARSLALHRLIDEVAAQDRRLASMQAELLRMGARLDAHGEGEPFDASQLNRMVD